VALKRLDSSMNNEHLMMFYSCLVCVDERYPHVDQDAFSPWVGNVYFVEGGLQLAVMGTEVEWKGTKYLLEWY
jgi:hypothetical protein